MNHTYFKIDPADIDLDNKIILLQEIEYSRVAFRGEVGMVVYNLNYFKQAKFSSEVPDKSFPKSCMYIVDKKASGLGIHIVNVEYFNKTAILGTKLTGDSYVPSGAPTIRLDMISKKLEMQYAWSGYRNPYWNKDLNLFESSTTSEIHLRRESTGVVDTFVHISQFTLKIKFLYKGRFKVRWNLSCFFKSNFCVKRKTSLG